MHYDDGLETQPGEDLSIGNMTLGPASYDVDGDGVADSYIMVGGPDEVDVLTDSDGDGQVDTVYQIDAEGSVAELQRVDGQMVQVGSGHLDEQGRIAMDGSDGSGGTTGGDGTGGLGGQPLGGDGDPGANTVTSGDMVMQDGGQSIDVGAPTMDLTGDGVNDTVALKGSDGSTVLVGDFDQNGQADNIAQLNPDGTVIFAVPDGHGGWVTAGTGHVDAGGSITQDAEGESGTPYQPPVDLSQATPGDPGTAGTGDPGSETGSGTPGAAAATGGDITVEVDGKVYDLGQADVDSDGDGTADSVVVRGEDGSTMVITDGDGNGTGDQIVQLNPDGSAVVQQSDGDGGWVTVATGHLDADGSLVIDQQAEQADTSDQTTGTDPGADPGAGSGQDMTVEVNGKVYDVGAPTMDADGNGTPDTSVVKTDDGTTLLVTDVDGNGTGDQITRVNPDGSVTVQQADGAGGWATVATGHLDADGSLVIDQR